MRPSNRFRVCFVAISVCAFAAAQSTTLTYNPGSTSKVEQIIGDCDWQAQAQQIVSGQPVTCKPTSSQTVTRFNILGTDVGDSFEADGKVVFSFGDTISKDVGAVNYHAGDPVAWSTSTDPEAGLLLNFYTNPDGSPLFVKPPGINMGADDIPNAGISLGGKVYLACNVGSDASLDNPQAGDHSILVRFDEAAHTFTYLREVEQPGGHFIGTALRASGGYVYIYGAGPYRASDVYLARTPISSFESGAGTQYFAGLANGQPTWSSTESPATPPVVEDNPLNGPAWPNDSPSAGNPSVAYSNDLGLWLMTYDGGRNSATPGKTSGVYLTYAPQPWGPWATPQLIFNQNRDNATGTYIHDPRVQPDPPGDGLNGPVIGQNDVYATGGGAYAPLMVERFIRVAGSTLKIYYSLSTWNPYTVVLMRSELTIAGCTYSLSAGGQGFSQQGGSGSIAVTTQPGCAWTVDNVPSWVSLTSPASGVGNGSVTFQVFPNSGGDLSDSFIVAGHTFNFLQEAGSIPGLSAVGSLAQVASEGGWNFSLNAINLGTSAAQARFRFTDEHGNPLALPLTLPQFPPASGALVASTLDQTIQPNAQFLMDSAGSANDPLVGWGQLSATAGVSGFGIFSNPAAGWNAAVPLETRNASKYILAFDNTNGVATGVAVANLAPQMAPVAVTIRDDSGVSLGNPQPMNLAAQGHTSFMLNDQYPITRLQRGTIEFDTPPGGQISVLGLRANGNALTTLPVLANVGTGGGSIAHATYNGGFTSTFYIVNTGTSAASFTLAFFDENGNPLAVPLSLPQSSAAVTTPALTRPLAAGAMLLVETRSQDTPPSVLGSAQLTTAGNIGGFEIFRWDPFGQEASVPLETRASGSFVLLFDDTGGLTTGVAVANDASSSANITVNLRDDTGALLPAQPIHLLARGHTSFLLPDTFPFSANRKGSAELVVPPGGKISVIGLRAGPGGTLTTIPVLAK